MSITQQIIIGSLIGVGTGLLMNWLMPDKPKVVEVRDSADGQFSLVIYDDHSIEYFAKSNNV